MLRAFNRFVPAHERSTVATLLAFAASAGLAGWLASASPDPRLAAMVVVMLASGCVLVLGATRWLRGRTGAWDALQPPLLVLLPALLSPGRPGFSLILFVSAGLALASSGRSALRERFGAPDAPGRALLRQETLGLVLLALILWLRQVELPIMTLDDGLDTGWSAALGRFLFTGKHAGTDWIFTAGPLSGLSSVVFQPELYWLKLVLWEGLWRLSSIFCLVLAGSRIPGTLQRCLYFLVLLLPEHYFDAQALTTLVAAGLLLDDRAERKQAGVEAIALLALAGMAWAKFTLLVATTGLLAALALARGLRRGRRSGLSFAGAAFGLLALIWFLAGQGIGNLWPYLRSSWEIASAYSEAQSLPVGDPSWRVLGLGCVSLIGLSLVCWTLAGGSSRSKAAAALGLAFVVFCAWKTGFVRASDHAQFFFSFAGPAPLLMPVPRVQGFFAQAGVAGLRLAAVLLGFLGIVRCDPAQTGLDSVSEEARRAPHRIQEALQTFAEPDLLKRSLEAQARAERANLRMPHILERVGRESVDILGYRPGVPMLLQLDWTPRPAFQGYITFTPWLQQQNADFLAGAQAPRFLLARIETIDDRWPMMDDALALEVASRCYDPVLMERDYLLLERRAEARPVQARERVLERELGFGETLAVPAAEAGCAQFLTLELEYTLRGRLARLLESTPELRLQLERTDGVVQSGRIVPVTMRSGMMIDPLIHSPGDWVNWMVGRELPHCQSLALEPPLGAEWMFEPRFRARIERVRGAQPARLPDFAFHDWMEMVFNLRPDESSTPIGPSLKNVAGHSVGVVHAPSRFIWRLAPGRYRITGRYGMLPETWQRKDIDGAEFRIVLLADKSASTLLHREFSPTQTDAERQMQELDLEFSLDRPGRLVLATSTGGKGNTACDWCYWSEVKLEDLAAPPPAKKP